MKSIQRTVLASALLTAKLLGLKHELVPYTTLNEKLGIQSGVTGDDATVTPTMKYWAIGDNGHNFTAGSNGRPYVTPVQHRPTDFAAFNQIPFVLRLPSDDLSATLRKNYGLRRTEVHDGKTYYAYYLKRLDLTDSKVTMQHVVIADGTSTVTALTPNESNLNPAKPTIDPVSITTTDGEFVMSSAPVNIQFTQFDAAELMKVAKILYGDENEAVISEIMMTTGIDKPVQVDTPAGKVSFTEVLMAQIYTHITAYYAIGFANQGFEFTVDIGFTEPLAAEGNVSATASSSFAAVRTTGI